jgi:hypothetical protein
MLFYYDMVQRQKHFVQSQRNESFFFAPILHYSRRKRAMDRRTDSTTL